MTTNTNPIATSSSRPIAGAASTGTSDAIFVRSSPDLALPLESEPANAADLDATTEPLHTESFEMPLSPDQVNERARENPGAAIAIAAAAGLLFGIAVKKMFPARRRR
jgi:hypothetical protein